MPKAAKSLVKTAKRGPLLTVLLLLHILFIIYLTIFYLPSILSGYYSVYANWNIDPFQELLFGLYALTAALGFYALQFPSLILLWKGRKRGFYFLLATIVFGVLQLANGVLAPEILLFVGIGACFYIWTIRNNWANFK